MLQVDLLMFIMSVVHGEQYNKQMPTRICSIAAQLRSYCLCLRCWTQEYVRQAVALKFGSPGQQAYFISHWFYALMASA
jgi:hypothetical protein